MSDIDTGASGPSKFAQFLTLLLGGGAAGLVGAVLSNVIEWQKVEAQAALTNQDFVNKYLTYVIDKDLDTRIRIAEYFEFILQDKDHRDRWQHYLSAITQKRTEWTPDYVKLLDKQDKGFALTTAENLRLGEIAKYFGEAEKLGIGVAKEAPKAPTPAIAPSAVAQQLANCALSQVGVAEQPPGSHRGPEVDEYLRASGLDPISQSGPWSGAFISWCLKTAAPSLGLKLSPNVIDIWRSAQQKGLAISAADVRQTSDIRIGDIYVTGGRGSTYAGIVVDVTEKPNFVGVDGNVGDAGNLGAGGSVKRMQRTLLNSPIVGLIRPTDEGASQGVATVTDQAPSVPTSAQEAQGKH